MNKHDFDLELNLMAGQPNSTNIKKIFSISKFVRTKMVKSFQKREHNNTIKSKTLKLAMIYILEISNSVSKIFKNHEINLSSSKSNSFMALQRNTKDKIEEGEKYIKYINI